jgi:hypothetical protein
VFIAALFTIIKLWKQLQFPSTEEWINEMWNMHTTEQHSALKKQEIVAYGTTWMKLEKTLSEISQSQRQIL